MSGYTDDPGDDVREHRLQQAERDKAPWTWRGKLAVCLMFAGPLAMLIAARIFLPS